jgi:hypothetical protein
MTGNAPHGRRYPPFYEKVVPIALGIIAIAVVVVLLLTVCVAVGLIPGTR